MSLCRTLRSSRPFQQNCACPSQDWSTLSKEEWTIKKTDFEELKAIVREVAEAQRELAQAQKRTEERLEELAQAQKRTEGHLEELAQAQKRTEDALARFERSFISQIGGLGARWGMQTEEAFRQGIRAILQEVGFTTERFLSYDNAGEVFGHPDQIKLDIVINNGKVIVIEIKSPLSKGETYLFDRKVRFYMRQTSRQIDRKLIVTPYVDNPAKQVGVQLGIEICTDINALN